MLKASVPKPITPIFPAWTSSGSAKGQGTLFLLYLILPLDLHRVAFDAVQTDAAQNLLDLEAKGLRCVVASGFGVVCHDQSVSAA